MSRTSSHREWGSHVRGVHAEIEAAFDEFDGRHGPDPAARILAEGGNPVAS
ncbi:hypothetical protein [Saccharopolyspora antimicrobica]|uniref:hypothetical protein n=1 Tax=Saccharopolyspora antimicrobica TaxID=455193 RepID=UPI001476DEDB|nr:hypothetical protein [Saccharopolyspora antimicrobica]